MPQSTTRPSSARTTCLWLFLTVLATASMPASGALVITISPTETGGLYAEASGTVDVTGLPQFGSHGIPHRGLISNDTHQQLTMNLGGSKSYRISDTAAQLFDADESFYFSLNRDFGTYSGDSFGVISVSDPGRTALMVPRDFTSGAIQGSVTINEASFAQTRPIEQVLTWGPGENQRVRIEVIPEPTTLAAGVVAVIMMSRRRRRAR